MPPTIVQIAASASMMNGNVGDVGVDYSDSHLDKEEPFLPQRNIPLPDLARRIGSTVHRFLKSKPRNDQIKAVQEQTKISLKVISEALDRYE